MNTVRDEIRIPESGYDLVRWGFHIDDAPVPWTDAVLQVRAEPNQTATLLAERSVAAGTITITEETIDGVLMTVVAVEFDEVCVAAIGPGTFAYDLRAFDASSHPHYPVAGPFVVPDTVTAPPVEETP